MLAGAMAVMGTMANQRVKAPKGTTTMRLPLEGCTMLLDLVILGEKLHFYIYYGKKSDL